MTETDNSGYNNDLTKKLGDAAFFKHMQRSGGLNYMNIDAGGNRKDSGNQLVYPHDVHTNAEYGQLVHFDIYHKQNPKMEDITQVIEKTVTTVADGAASLAIGTWDGVAGAAKTMWNEGVVDGGGKILGNIGSMFTDGLVAGSDWIDKASTAPNRTNEEIIKDTRLGKADVETKDKVTLYLPGGLSNKDDLAYQDHDLGLIKGISEGNFSSLIPGLAQKAASFADSVVEFAGGELNTAPAMSALMGAVRNPRKEQIFDSVGFRTFDFTFNFRPKNSDEALIMMTICKLFRFHAHPELNPSMAYLLTPSEFQITFIDLKNPNPDGDIGAMFGSDQQTSGYAHENQWINKIGRCALTSVTVDYHPNNVSNTFEDGIPIAVDLTLSFTEMEAITRNHIHAGF
jgi:hypothetical protein